MRRLLYTLARMGARCCLEDHRWYPEEPRDYWRHRVIWRGF